MKRAFADLNLTRNPFGELVPEERAATAVLDLEPVLAPLRDGLSVQLVGRCGRGKSTHLRALQAALPDAMYARVWSREHTGRWPPETPEVPAGTAVLLLDEADMLPFWSRVPTLRRARAVVVATHTSLALSLRLAGHRAVTVPVARPPTLAFLREAVTRRVVYFRRTDGPVPLPSDAELQSLLDRHGDDLRGIERELYEHYQTRSL